MRHRKQNRFFRFIFIAGLGGLLLWGLGFLYFVTAIVPSDSPFAPDAFSYPNPNPTATTLPAIVVLTGGSLRIDTGLDALRNGYGERLFISGVYRGNDVQKLLTLSRNLADSKDNSLIERIELGHEAEDTIGNAIEITDWLRRNQYANALVVTGAYHMPRSLMELRNHAPELTFIPAPVFPNHVKLDQWYHNKGTAALLLREYHKYLWGNIRIIVGYISV